MTHVHKFTRTADGEQWECECGAPGPAIDIRAASFVRKTFCLVASGEPIGKEYADFVDAWRAKTSLEHYIGGSASPDWLRMSREIEQEAA